MIDVRENAASFFRLLKFVAAFRNSQEIDISLLRDAVDLQFEPVFE
jgi:hypothetical protein